MTPNKYPQHIMGKTNLKEGTHLLKVMLAPFKRGNICKSKHYIFQNAHPLWMKSYAK
jgi:hypothetical protein